MLILEISKYTIQTKDAKWLKKSWSQNRPLTLK